MESAKPYSYLPNGWVAFKLEAPSHWQAISMKPKSYKGFAIAVRPYQLHDTGQWTVDIEISRKGRTRSFSTTEHFATEAEAVTRSFDFGRKIIDGQVPECSVDNLR